MTTREILIEGYTAEQLASMVELDELVLTGAPIVFRVSAAQILAEFSIHEKCLTVEFAVAENGGDGILFTLIDAIEHIARRKQLTTVHWIVHAIDCAQPNPKLQRVLEKFDFETGPIQSGVIAYQRTTSTNDSLLRRS